VTPTPDEVAVPVDDKKIESVVTEPFIDNIDKPLPEGITEINP
jgi:hypothetical protein